MNIKLMGTTLLRRVRRVGVYATLRQAAGMLRQRNHQPDAFDLEHGTDTAEAHPLWQFKIDSPNARFGAAYQTIDQQALVEAIGATGQDPAGLTFVDVGCGKGRALLVAAKLGFERILGVEFVPELAAIARRNLEQAGATNATVVAGDAAQFQFPDADLVLYLFNPFSEEVMRQVVENLRRQRGRLFVIYAMPRCAALFDDCGFLTAMGAVPGRSDIHLWQRAP